MWDIGFQSSLKKTLILSVLFHAGLAFILLSIALSRSTRSFAPQVYRVDLVALPSSPTTPVPPAAVKEVAAEPAPPIPKPPVQEAVRPKIEIKKPPVKPRPKSVAPVAAVPSSVKAGATAPSKEAAIQKNSPVAAISPMNTQVLAKVEGLDPNSSYYGNITRKIEIYWSPPFESTAEIKEAVVNFILYPSGRIADPTIEKSSGNVFFDQAALRAVYEANPLPPFPQGIRDSSLKVHFSFLLKKKS